MRLLLGALLVVSACAAPATSSASTGSPSPVASTSRPSPRATLQVNVDSMMGNVPSATVFVLADGQLHAVNLLNHHGRYAIDVGRAPQAAISPDGSRLYVADEIDSGLRLRAFDAVSGYLCCEVLIPGTERKERLVDAAMARGALAATDAAVFLLIEAGAGVRLEAFAATLAQIGVPAKLECGDRVLATESRVAIVCLTAGRFTMVEPAPRRGPAPTAGGLVTQAGDGRELAGAVMVADGTLIAVRPDGSLLRLKAGSIAIEPLDSYPPGAGGVIRDGLAIADKEQIVVARKGKDATVQVHSSTDGRLMRGPYKLPTEPTSGVLALWPFAYFTAARGVWHVDLQNGLLETMVTVEGPSLGALAPR